MSITISPSILRRLPSDNEEASALVNEILEQALALGDPQQDLENRPDLQASLQTARDQIRAGNTVSHRDVLRWNNGHR